MSLEGPFRAAILFLGLSAVLHSLAPFLSGFHPDGIALAMTLPVFVVMLWGLSQDWRWFAYLCFFIAAIGGIVALSFIWSTNPVPSLIYIAILIADWLAAAALFRALWRSAPVVEPGL